MSREFRKSYLSPFNYRSLSTSNCTLNHHSPYTSLNRTFTMTKDLNQLPKITNTNKMYKKHKFIPTKPKIFMTVGKSELKVKVIKSRQTTINREFTVLQSHKISSKIRYILRLLLQRQEDLALIAKQNEIIIYLKEKLANQMIINKSEAEANIKFKTKSNIQLQIVNAQLEQQVLQYQKQLKDLIQICTLRHSENVELKDKLIKYQQQFVHQHKTKAKRQLQLGQNSQVVNKIHRKIDEQMKEQIDKIEQILDWT